jgi:hypothetical protein
LTCAAFSASIRRIVAGSEGVRLKDLTYQEWLEHVFGHEVRFQQAAWFFDRDCAWWDPASFALFLEDGRVCLSNNAAERGLRGIALGRKFWLFCGSDRGGRRAAASPRTSAWTKTGCGTSLSKYGDRGWRHLVYGVGEDGVQAFTDFGIENLIELVRFYKENPELLRRWRRE